MRLGVFAPDVHKRYGSISGLRGESGLRVDCVHYRPRDFVFGRGATAVKPFDGDVEKHSRIKVRRVFVGVRIIRDVYFKDALVSVISLQYVLINTFGDGVNGVMLTVSEVTGSLLWLLMVTVAAFSMAQAIRLRKSRKNSASSEE